MAGYLRVDLSTVQLALLDVVRKVERANEGRRGPATVEYSKQACLGWAELMETWRD